MKKSHQELRVDLETGESNVVTVDTTLTPVSPEAIPKLLSSLIPQKGTKKKAPLSGVFGPFDELFTISHDISSPDDRTQSFFIDKGIGRGNSRHTLLLSIVPSLPLSTPLTINETLGLAAPTLIHHTLSELPPSMLLPSFKGMSPPGTEATFESAKGDWVIEEDSESRYQFTYTPAGDTFIVIGMILTSDPDYAIPPNPQSPEERRKILTSILTDNVTMTPFLFEWDPLLEKPVNIGLPNTFPEGLVCMKTIAFKRILRGKWKRSPVNPYSSLMAHYYEFLRNSPWNPDLSGSSNVQKMLTSQSLISIKTGDPFLLPEPPSKDRRRVPLPFSPEILTTLTPYLSL